MSGKDPEGGSTTPQPGRNPLPPPSSNLPGHKNTASTVQDAIALGLAGKQPVAAPSHQQYENSVHPAHHGLSAVAQAAAMTANIGNSHDPNWVPEGYLEMKFGNSKETTIFIKSIAEAQGQQAKINPKNKGGSGRTYVCADYLERMKETKDNFDSKQCCAFSVPVYRHRVGGQEFEAISNKAIWYHNEFCRGKPKLPKARKRKSDKYDSKGSKMEFLHRIDTALAKAALFLRKNMPQNDHSWNGGDPNFSLTVGQYMVLPLAYQGAGMQAEALESMEYINRRFLQGDGAGCYDPACLEADYFIPYAPAWIAVSAVQMGRGDLAQKCMRHVLPFQGRGRIGGFFCTMSDLKSGKGVFCFDTSATATMACLWTGNLDQARRAGEYILRLAEVSSNSTWVWSLDEQGNAVTSKEGPWWDAHKVAKNTITVKCTMDKETPNQPHWKTGLYLATCSYLYRYFGDQKYLMAAIQCVRFAFDCYDARHGWPMWGHQLAWGAAELYKDTYDTKVLALARQLGQMLVERQSNMGFFPYTEWYTEREPPRITYSICAQSTVWLSKVREALRLSMTRGTDGTTTNMPSFKGLRRKRPRTAPPRSPVVIPPSQPDAPPQPPQADTGGAADPNQQNQVGTPV